MDLSIEDIRQWIEGAIADVYVDTTTENLFFFKGEERSFPFATIVTRDDDYDRASELDREGLFRLNFQVPKPVFRSLFPDLADREALEGAEIDYRALDTLFPHPVYGRMYWVSVINPNRTWPECKSLLLG